MSTAAYASEPNLRRAGSTALPLVVAILIVLFLSVPDQMREIYRLHAGAWNSVSWSLLQPVYALIALMALSFFLWRIARETRQYVGGIVSARERSLVPDG